MAKSECVIGGLYDFKPDCRLTRPPPGTAGPSEATTRVALIMTKLAILVYAEELEK